MKKVFLDYDQAGLDAQYEQRTFVPHADAIIQRYVTASDAVRQRLGEPETHRYGASEVEQLDIYGPGHEKLVVFVHGGAWKRQGRRGQAFAAEPFVWAGAGYVQLERRHAPAKSSRTSIDAYSFTGHFFDNSHK